MRKPHSAWVSAFKMTGAVNALIDTDAMQKQKKTLKNERTHMKENAEKTAVLTGRNKCLDFFKGIAALCVVFVHIPFPGKFGKCVSSAGSCGVMLFFLISGFYAYGPRDEMRPKLMKRFRRNLLITVIALLVYFVMTAFDRYRSEHTLRAFFRQMASPTLI